MPISRWTLSYSLGMGRDCARSSVQEDSYGIREADHREPPGAVLARATTRMSWLAGREFAVGMRSRIPLGGSASLGSESRETHLTTRTVTGRPCGTDQLTACAGLAKH